MDDIEKLYEEAEDIRKRLVEHVNELITKIYLERMKISNTKDKNIKTKIEKNIEELTKIAIDVIKRQKLYSYFSDKDLVFLGFKDKLESIRSIYPYEGNKTFKM